MEDGNEVLEKVDEIIKKIIAVWLWSIAFGLACGIGYNSMALTMAKLMNSSGFAKANDFVVIFMAFTAIGLICAVVAFVFLFLYLSKFILPFVFRKTSDGWKFENTQKANRYLMISYGAIIVSGIIRALAGLFSSY